MEINSHISHRDQLKGKPREHPRVRLKVKLVLNRLECQRLKARAEEIRAKVRAVTTGTPSDIQRSRSVRLRLMSRQKQNRTTMTDMDIRKKDLGMRTRKGTTTKRMKELGGRTSSKLRNQSHKRRLIHNFERPCGT